MITPGYAATETDIYVVNALPAPKMLDVAIDGKTVAPKVGPGVVLPPFKGKPGSKVTFMENGATIGVTTIKTKAPDKAFVVEHLLADAESDPVAQEFTVKIVKVPRGKGWLEFSNVAATTPLDFRTKDQVLFENFANGDISSPGLQVTAATYKAAITPTGQTKPVLCCTDDLTVEAGKITVVFAFGNSVNIAVGQLDAVLTGSEAPSEVNTGTGGQAIGDGRLLDVNLAR